jgi:transposase
LTLFAALNYLEGKLITRLAPRHRHQEWLAFLKLIDQQSPAELDIHIIADNYATHKHPQVKKWLERHSRFHMHFTPTSSSWMNLMERFFGDLTALISEKSFASTHQLADAIIHLPGRPQRPPSALRVEGQRRRYLAQNRPRQTRARRRHRPRQSYFGDTTLGALP